MQRKLGLTMLISDGGGGGVGGLGVGGWGGGARGVLEPGNHTCGTQMHSTHIHTAAAVSIEAALHCCCPGLAHLAQQHPGVDGSPQCHRLGWIDAHARLHACTWQGRAGRSSGRGGEAGGGKKGTRCNCRHTGLQEKRVNSDSAIHLRWGATELQRRAMHPAQSTPFKPGSAHSTQPTHL